MLYVTGMGGRSSFENFYNEIVKISDIQTLCFGLIKGPTSQDIPYRCHHGVMLIEGYPDIMRFTARRKLLGR